MKRRSFLSLLGLAAVVAPLARLLPTSAVVSPLLYFPEGPVEVNSMRGMPYLVSNTGDYFGMTWHAYPPEDVVSAKRIRELEALADQEWFDSLPKDRSLIPADYRRG